MVYRCNFCGGREYNLIYQGKDIIRCENCGLASLLTMPSDSEVQELYEKEYSIGESFNRFYANLSVVRKAEASLRLRSISRLAQGQQLLDAGSGLGYFVEAAIEQGWDAQGVEISRKAIELQGDRGLPIFHCPYESFEAGNLYDVITLWAVLEHVLNPRRVLEKTYELLKPGGIVVIETVDISSHNAKKDGADWRMFYIAGHLYFFSSACLDMVLDSIGFTVLETHLDKWVEHILMQNEAQNSILIANSILPQILVKVMSDAKCYINRVAASLGLGDVIIKVAQKPRIP